MGITIGSRFPFHLFRNSEPGVIFDPSDLSTLFQDTAGSTPVTTPGQTVALMLDKSRGLITGPELISNGDFSNRAVGWLVLGSDIALPSEYVVDGVLRLGTATSQTAAASISTLSTTSVVRVTFRARKISGNVELQVWFSQQFGANQVTARSFGDISTEWVNYSLIFFNTDVTRTRFAFREQTGTGGVIEIDNVSVRELPGFHATQATAAERPTYGIVPRTGRRNLFERTESFTISPWADTVSGTSTRADTASIYSFGLGLITATSANGGIRQTISGLISGQPYTLSFYLESSTPAVTIVFENGAAAYGSSHFATINPSTGEFSSIQGFTSTTSVGFGNGRIYTMVAGNAGGSLIANIEWRITTNGGSIILGRPHFEIGASATAYQRVGSQFDVTEAGIPTLHYLYFGGSSDPRWMQTATITPNADKVQVFAGVRKLSDAANSIIAEYSPDIGFNNGSFGLLTLSTVAYRSNSRGTILAQATRSAVAAPSSDVLTVLADISGPSNRLRVDGISTVVTATQGTGNYLAYPLYIGRRGGTSLPFNGQLYGLVVRFGSNLDSYTITNVERQVALKTGVSI